MGIIFILLFYLTTITLISAGIFNLVLTLNIMRYHRNSYMYNKLDNMRFNYTIYLLRTCQFLLLLLFISVLWWYFFL